MTVDASSAVLRNLGINSALLSKSLARLSSGQRIVSPEDDPGGLAISIKLDGEIQRNNAAASIVTNATSLTQAQDGLLQQVEKALDRMSELGVLAQDSSKSASDISSYTSEFTQLQSFISDVGTKNFSSTTMFGSTGLSVLVDPQGTTITLNALDINNSAVTIGLANIFNTISTGVGNATSAAQALSNVQTAISTLASMRAVTGANIERLNFSSDTLSSLTTNLTAASGAITNVDMATEASNFAKYQLLVQAGTTMLAQANSLRSSTLQILQSI